MARHCYSSIHAGTCHFLSLSLSLTSYTVLDMYTLYYCCLWCLGLLYRPGQDQPQSLCTISELARASETVVDWPSSLLQLYFIAAAILPSLLLLLFVVTIDLVALPALVAPTALVVAPRLDTPVSLYSQLPHLDRLLYIQLFAALNRHQQLLAFITHPSLLITLQTTIAHHYPVIPRSHRPASLFQHSRLQQRVGLISFTTKLEPAQRPSTYLHQFAKVERWFDAMAERYRAWTDAEDAIILKSNRTAMSFEELVEELMTVAELRDFDEILDRQEELRRQSRHAGPGSQTTPSLPATQQPGISVQSVYFNPEQYNLGVIPPLFPATYIPYTPKRHDPGGILQPSPLGYVRYDSERPNRRGILQSSPAAYVCYYSDRPPVAIVHLERHNLGGILQGNPPPVESDAGLRSEPSASLGRPKTFKAQANQGEPQWHDSAAAASQRRPMVRSELLRSATMYPDTRSSNGYWALSEVAKIIKGGDEKKDWREIWDTYFKYDNLGDRTPQALERKVRLIRNLPLAEQQKIRDDLVFNGVMVDRTASNN
ncbi:uncharacterized protein BDZ99DRAFT_31446 [Mytilinidion resinicola]|uniref:Uncharacterized protein n=1 Tax=Mytilinidion resinicola TaxID=574789 RepID=A0A6A6YM07_9PEZI|nr:uncharacterized protein BDZ99DRAFT_31446 [Mytilinidion resinicola]KAF2809568.1 hypothetical protein BDZ99DRAFT_31446 [Mytilinidion resinicola]